MAWRIDAPPPFADLTPLIQLEDEHGSLIYRGDAYMAGTDEWRTGETLIQRMSVEIPPGDAARRLTRVRIAWVGRASDSYVPYFNAQRRTGRGLGADRHADRDAPGGLPRSGSLPIAVRQHS